MLGHLHWNYTGFELPAREDGKPYSLKELLEIAERDMYPSCDLLKYYDDLYFAIPASKRKPTSIAGGRVALAMQELEEVVDKAVAVKDSEMTGLLFPRDEVEYNESLKAATGWEIRNGHRESRDKVAKRDSLAMARKHVVDQMLAQNPTFCHPTNAALHVQQLILLMAQNAKLKKLTPEPRIDSKKRLEQALAKVDYFYGDISGVSLRDHYRDSFRVALAIDELQSVIAQRMEHNKRTDNPKEIKSIFPKDGWELEPFEAPELHYDHSRLKTHGGIEHDNLSLEEQLHLLARHSDDPLKMARKHVVDQLIAHAAPNNDNLRIDNGVLLEQVQELVEEITKSELSVRHGPTRAAGR